MELFSGIRRVLRLGAWRRELDDELVFHFEETVRELMESGMGEREAKEEAARRFGDPRRWRRELERLDRWADARARWGARAEAVGSSVTLALRRIRRSPGFAAGVVLTFGLGIGANAMMFSIIDRLLLSPPAHVVDAEGVRRIMVEETDRLAGERRTVDALTYPEIEDLRRSGAFRAVAAISRPEMLIGSGPGAEKWKANLVSGDYFSLLGVRPEVGRFFDASQDAKGGPAVAVISHDRWLDAYGGAADVLGRTVDFGQGPFEIVGVAPKGFTGIDLEPVDLWLPFLTTAARTNAYCVDSRDCTWLRAVGRLAPGATVERAQAEGSVLLERGWASFERRGDRRADARLVAAPLLAARGPLASQESRVALWVGGIALFVLLIACANIANLFLARATRAQREIGVRLALGSSGIRVVGPIVAESVLLAAAGGLVALGIAAIGTPLVGNLLLQGYAWDEVGTGRGVAGVVLVLVAFAGLLSVIVPAVHAARAPISGLFRSGVRTSAPASRTRDALIVAQTALSVLLLVGAGLFIRSLQEVRSLDLGLDPDGVLILDPRFERGVTDAAGVEFHRRTADRLRTVPGVLAVAKDNSVPFWGSSGGTLGAADLDSIPSLPSGPPILHSVTGEYFDVLDLQITHGRAFLPEDRASGQLVAVINRTMAQHLWPGQEVIGKCLLVGDNPNDPERPPCTEVVGVVENARRFSIIEEEGMQYYLFDEQYPPDASGSFLIRHLGDPAPVREAIRRLLHAEEPRLRFVEVREMRELVDPQARSWTLGATMLTAFGVLALLVAGSGLYSVLAFGVTQRTQELGIRSALGAGAGALVGLVVGRAVRLVGLGIAVGLAVAAAAGSRLEPLLFQVSPRDPVVLGIAAVVLLVTAVLAAGVPARRATRVDPAVALRAE